MKLKYVITAVGTICSGVTASHLDRFHGLRSLEASTLAEQKEKNCKCNIDEAIPPYPPHNTLTLSSFFCSSSHGSC